jgi:hypothetical protein
MLAFDEEVDYLEYQNYLRIQSTSELCDIVGHLDYFRCPRRAEAANRELCRRHVYLDRCYSETENIWRNLTLISIFVGALTLLLSLTMSRDEAISPQPPPSLNLTATGSFVQFSSSAESGGDQMTVSIIGVYVAQLGENVLRDAVQLASRSGLYLIMLVATVWKFSLSFKRRRFEDTLREELRRLLTISLVVQLFVLLAGAGTNLPVLANDGHFVSGGLLARAVTLFAPWG